MRIVTFNAGLLDPLIPGVRERAVLLAARLPALEADVIVLQEVWEERDVALLSDALEGSHVAVPADPLPTAPGDWAAGGRTGLILFGPPRMSANVASLDSWFVRRAVICVDVDVGGETLLILATHLSADIPPIPHPEPGGWEAEHRRQVEHLIVLAGRHEGPALVVGDLNCGPGLPGVDPEFEDGYRRLVEAFPRSVYLEDDEPLCTFCADNPLQPFSQSTLLDHVLARGIDGPAAARRILDEPVVVDGDEMRLSDHYGLEVDFEGL
jgi:endonuclease/exonuclease/phosphatase family metal-dependent hydrolase